MTVLFDLFVDLFTETFFCQFQIISNLQVQPKFRIYSKICTQPKRSVRSNFTLAIDDLVDSVRRYSYLFSQLCLRYFQGREKFFKEYISGLNGR